MKRAQAWGFDLIVGLIIFLIGLSVLYIYTINFPLTREEEFAKLTYEGGVLSDGLLSEGFPQDWTEENVIEIGILSGGSVNNTKLKRLYELSLSNYQKTKNLFNVLNDYYIYFDQPIVIDDIEISGIGRRELNQKNLVKISRAVVHDNKIKNINIHLWN